MENKFLELAKVNVNEHVEKKNNLSYLSWAWAVHKLLENDPLATWEYKEPVRWNETVMVFCTVTAFGKQMTAQLPVMDHRNKAIVNPDAFAVNTAMQRCLAKAIALHGLGLYIYAGEDLPLDEGSAEEVEWAENHAMKVRSFINDANIIDAAAYINGLGIGGSYDAEAKEAVWGRLESTIRSAIRAYDAITQSQSLDALKRAWDAAPKHSHKMLEPVKDKRKEELKPKDGE